MIEEQVVESTEEVADEIQTEESAVEEVVEEVAEEPVITPKKKQTAQERIDEVTRLRRDAEREAEYWKKAALAKEKETPSEPPKPQAAQLPQRPAIEHFETTTEYEDALFEWRDRVKAIEGENTTRQRQYDSALATFNDRARVFRAEHPDFDETIESPVFSTSMRAAILQSENGPQVAYYLGQSVNFSEAERIRSLPVESQLLELGRLEMKLEIARKTKKVTSAPAPIKPVGMGGAGGEVDPSKMTVQEWMAWDKQRSLDRIKQKLGG